jgi:cell division transport system permease protein
MPGGWLARYAGNIWTYAWRWQRRRKTTWLVTVVAVGAVLSVASTVQLLVSLGEGSLARQLRSASEMQVFLADGIGPDQQASLEARLAAVPGVKHVGYRSKAQAASLAAHDLQLAPLVAASDGNPFPASLVLLMTDPQVGRRVLAAVAGDPGVDASVPASYTAAQAQQLSSALRMVKVGSLALDAVALGVGVIVALALLRSEVRTRREELRILTLVGVPRAVIRLPLVIQVLSVALAGSVPAILSLVYVSRNVVPAINQSLPFLRLGDPAALLVTLCTATLAASCLALIPCALLVRLPR